MIFSDVLVKRHAAVNHHGCAFLKPGARRQHLEHGGERRAVLGIAGKHLVSDGKAVAIDHQSDHDLLAVGTMIARVAALGLGVAGAHAFEISRGEIVEIDRDIEIEQAALALDQCRFDGGAVRMKLVEHLIKRVFFQSVEVGAEEVAERGAPQPRRHGVFGGGRNQAIEHHGAGEPPHRCREAGLAQDAVKFEALPELIADMDRTGLAVMLGGDARRIDFDQRAAGGVPR